MANKAELIANILAYGEANTYTEEQLSEMKNVELEKILNDLEESSEAEGADDSATISEKKADAVIKEIPKAYDKTVQVQVKVIKSFTDTFIINRRYSGIAGEIRRYPDEVAAILRDGKYVI